MPNVCEICDLDEFQSVSNLSYYRARYYDPAAGRFVSEDPVGFAVPLFQRTAFGVSNCVAANVFREYYWL